MLCNYTQMNEYFSDVIAGQGTPGRDGELKYYGDTMNAHWNYNLSADIGFSINRAISRMLRDMRQGITPTIGTSSVEKHMLNIAENLNSTGQRLSQGQYNSIHSHLMLLAKKEVQKVQNGGRRR